MRLPLLAIAAIGCQPDPPPPEVWEREADYYVAHPILGHVHKPNATRVTAVPEHPDGQVTFRTNAAGFRNSREFAVPKPPHTFRVLVVGDSHTDGVVDNSEGFGDGLARHLDVAFAEHRISDHIDVINGGTGYWGPAQYGQAFSVWAHLEPDACVVMLFEGNDLLDAVAAEERAGKRHIGRLEDHYDRLYAVAEHVGERVSQQLNQDLLFAHAPSAAIDAVRLTREAIVEAHDTCAAFDAPLVVVRLPPSGAVHPPTPAETAHIQAILGPIPWLSGRTLADGFNTVAAQLREKGLEATTANDVVSLVRSGDLAAIQAVRQAGRDIGEMLNMCVSLINPSLIVIGGSLAQSGEHLIAGIRETVYARSTPLATQHLNITQSETGPEAGVVGASILAVEHALAPERVNDLAATLDPGGHQNTDRQNVEHVAKASLRDPVAS